MEKQVLKKEKEIDVNGFIITVQSYGVSPRQSFVDTPSSLAKTIASILDSNPYAVILVQASLDL